jgi:hypothetical protein
MTTGSPNDAGNRRAAPRKAIRQPATVVLGDVTRSVRTWDLGRDGMCLLAARPISPGTRCKVVFELPIGGELVSVTAPLKIVYSSYSAVEEFKIGAMFTDLDESVAELLRRFAATP